MAIDNSLHDSLENTYFQIKEYFDNNQLGREHSPMIVKHEELADLLEGFDIEALEEQTKDIHALHAQLDDIREVSKKVVEDLEGTDDSIAMTAKVVSGLDEIFLKITNLVL